MGLLDKIFYEGTRIVVRNGWPRYLYTVMINLTQVKNIKEKKLKNGTPYFEVCFEGEDSCINVTDTDGRRILAIIYKNQKDYPSFRNELEEKTGDE